MDQPLLIHRPKSKRAKESAEFRPEEVSLTAVINACNMTGKSKY